MANTCCILVSLVLVACQPRGVPDLWVVPGRVLDPQGQPVADVGISTLWSANGVSHEEAVRFEKEGGDGAKFSAHEGWMEPWGNHPTKTDTAGRFSIGMEWHNFFLLAMDKERKRGALIVLDPRHAPPSLDVTLAPLLRLHGRVHIAAAAQAPEWSLVVVRLPRKEGFPLGFERMAWCSSLKARFEFMLPPGDYLFEAAAQASGRRHELSPFRAITVAAGTGDVDAGTLELTPEQPTWIDRMNEAKEKGTRVAVDHTKLYGQPAPRWFAVDARGIPKNAQVSDFKGKWVLVYLWATSCAKCLGKTLPGLMEFYKAHEAQRDRFAIVAICIEPEGKWKSMADLDQALKPVVKFVWGGQTLPFPVLFDNTLNTLENWGVGAYGRKHLIDPTGCLVPGDENTLGEKLRDHAESKANVAK
jgi:AhpC/TSA family